MSSNGSLASVGILWAQYGPYHFARVAALKEHAGPVKVFALELASQTADYAWTRSVPFELITLCPGEVVERLPFWRVFFRARRIFAELNLDVCILPSYAPQTSLAAFLAAKSLGIRTVMMNESHAGTARATGAAAQIKRRLVAAFDAALVGGLPQKRYFASLGLPTQKIFTGYDAVDNRYFAEKAAAVKNEAATWRPRYDLPSHYFLSLGRFVAKKNLPALIRAYAKLLADHQGCQTHLVMVGSGEEESRLKALCADLKLPVYEKTDAGTKEPISNRTAQPPGVHFYGFRQIDENPVFYALADAFILPSLWEEWGLVVNEAMASGLPVIVSETVGCVEDLLEPGFPPGLAAPDLQPPLKMVAGLRQNGFAFNPEDPESLADALLDLALHPDLRTAMGQTSRRIVEKFSCDNFARNALRSAQVAMGDNPSQLNDSTAGKGPAGLDSRSLP
jgi:glycosyltransferase involved in cell wall biosynthesis